MQVAFILAGATQATYVKVLQHALGREAVAMVTFLGTVRCMFPVVKGMLDEMCELAKQDMKALPESELGSWKRAVTTAEGSPNDASMGDIVCMAWRKRAHWICIAMENTFGSLCSTADGCRRQDVEQSLQPPSSPTSTTTLYRHC